MSGLIAEQWRPLPSDPRYQVSDQGRVCNRDTSKAARILKASKPPSGNYLLVSIGQRTYGVHVLVAETFLGPRPAGMHVRHLDDNKLNNRVSNLAYGTAMQNAEDRKRNGLYAHGSGVVTAKLTEDLVRAIRASTGSHPAVARQFGVGRETVRLIRNNMTWRHV